MFHSRKINTKINKLYERCIRFVYSDITFEELLDKASSTTIHMKNIKTLAFEMYKVANGILPEIMKTFLTFAEK